MKQTISSQFKYTIDLGVKATKTTFKIKKSIKDIVMHILAILFIGIFAGVLVWDILHNKSIVLDLIILIALVGIEIFNLVMPLIIVSIQKKFLRKLDLAQNEYTLAEINKDKCVESFYKDGKITMQNVCDMNKLVGYQVDSNYVFLVFDNFACAIFDTTTLTISLEEFIKHLDIVISKNKTIKTKR